MKSIEETNGKLMAMFLFQYSLIIPFTQILSATKLVAVTSIILVGICIFLNFNSSMNYNILRFFFLMLILIILKTLIDKFSDFSLIVNFVVYALPVFILYLYKFDIAIFLEEGYKLAIINFIILVLNPFLGPYEYMRFGYGMLPTTIFLYIRNFYYNEKDSRKKKINIIVLIVSSIEILLYGARGSFFCILLFLVIDVFLINRRKVIKNMFLIFCTFFLMRNIIYILDFLQKIVDFIGIRSYTLIKFKMQLQNGIASASSGRDVLYAEAINKIKRNPLFGNTVTFETGDEYVHNLFLQVAVDLGLIIVVILILYLLYLVILMCRKNVLKEKKMILAILFSMAIGRLMVSSSLWKRPEFWMLICYGLTISFKEKENISLIGEKNS